MQVVYVRSRDGAFVKTRESSLTFHGEFHLFHSSDIENGMESPKEFRFECVHSFFSHKNVDGRRFIIIFHYSIDTEHWKLNNEKLCFLHHCSKVSQRKIPSRKLSDKCVHCHAKVELDKLKEFVTCKGCEELACHNQKCSEFIFGLDVWECARCKKNRWDFLFDGTVMDVTQCHVLNCRVIQQKAGEWLLKQLNQMKDSDEAIHLKKENILSADGEDEINIFASTCTNDHYHLFQRNQLMKAWPLLFHAISAKKFANSSKICWRECWMGLLMMFPSVSFQQTKIVSTLPCKCLQ